jgi:hypothetical protein
VKLPHHLSYIPVLKNQYLYTYFPDEHFKLNKMGDPQQIDVNMFTSPFQLTKSMHRELYAAVEPSNPALSAKGKVVIITGASGGLGAVSTSLCFSKTALTLLD